MFNDEESFACKKMHEFSTVDGFMEISESLADMMKYVANEPSVGLFYIQQHTQNAVPNLVNLKNTITDKSHEMTLHTEDMEDSIAIVSSMKDCGFPIVDGMIKDIRKSLDIMLAKQPKRGFIRGSSLGFQIGRTSSWGPATWAQDGERTGSYLSTVFKSAKQRASNFKWPQLDSKDSKQAKLEQPLPYNNPPSLATVPSTSSTMLDAEADELPLSSQIADEVQEEEPQDDRSSSSHQLLTLAENYDEFRADKEAKLEEWLGGTGNQDDPV